MTAMNPVRLLRFLFCFLFPCWVSWIPAAVSVANTVFGSSGGSSQGNGRMYTPGGLGQADQGWQQNQAANQGQLGYGGGFAGAVDPAMYQAFQNLQGINYDPYLQASQQAGQQYGNLAGIAGNYGGAEYGQSQNNLASQQALQQAGAQTYQQAQGLANGLQGQGQNFYGAMQGLAQPLQQAGQAAYQAGFDPQQALYDRTLQQVTDQSAATNSMYGLGQSGAGAGAQNQALSNFNIDWQNQQLGREMQGIGAMQGANQAAAGIQGQGLQGLLSGTQLAGQLGSQGLGAYGRSLQEAGNLGNYGSADLQQSLAFMGQAPGFTQQSASVPMQAQQQAYGQPFQNVGQFSGALMGAMNPYQSQQNAAGVYMNLGQTGQYNAGQLGLAQQQWQNQQQQQLGNALGNVNWGQLQGMFGGGGDPYANSGGGVGTGGYYGDAGQMFNNPSAYIPGP